MEGTASENPVSNDGRENGLLLYYHQYSFYSQKVLLALHEKKLPYKSHIVNLIKGEQYQPWFLHINPRGEVPVLKDGIKIIPDSGRIIDYLEDNFSNGSTPRLMPLEEGADVRSKVTHFRSLLDHIPAGAITMGSFFHTQFCDKPKPPFIQPVRRLLQSAEKNSSTNLRLYAEKNPESRDTLLQKANSQDARHEALLNKDEFKKLLDQTDSILQDVEKELSSHTEDKTDWWLCCNHYTVADISLTILLDRLYRLGLENYFWANGKKPHIANYYQRVQLRDSYQKTIPSTLFHFKTLLQFQMPFVIGLGIVAAFAVLIGGLFYMRKK
ncbi:hypothetical protein R5R35_012791 [Gryllus longicercus]|uniref:Ganglioside-induced differentiation-associated protein 1 n=1 Tax=Gryllus longicercus TaxID=2509291 RepID=A0AAN9VRE6_9ORTH